MMNLKKLSTLARHLWLDAADTRRAMPADMLDRLAQQISASETSHSGQIRIFVEAALPMSYVWRLGQSSMAQLVHQRALMQFGKLGIWDTEHNNGVLIYLLLAEHAIEIVADRGLSRHVPSTEWQTMLDRMGNTFRQQQFEQGLNDALAGVTALLARHFPKDGENVVGINELPNEPVLG